MPCYDPETHERPIRLEARVHELTRMLCHTCGVIENNHCLGVLSEETQKWWKHHKEMDAEIDRIKRKEKEVGFNGLTPKERGMLYTSDDISYGQDRPSFRVIGVDA